MAINKVEYKLASTTAGFAEAGDSVTIKSNNAKIIQKDVDEGCVEKLNNATQNFLKVRLDHATPSDETEYEGGAEGEGEGDITEGEGDTTNSDGENKDSGAPSGSGGSGLNFGPALLTATTALLPIMNTATSPWIGAIDLALGVVSAKLVAEFDNQFRERMAETAASSEYITEIQGYEEILNTDIETMTSTMEELEEAEKGQETSPEQEKTEPDSDEGALESLYAELEQAKNDGDEEKIAEIQAQIDEITASLGEGENDAEDPMAEIQLNNEGAHSVQEYNGKVAQFLSEGNNLGALGVVNATSLAGSAVNSRILSKEALVGFPFPSAGIGSALAIAASATFATSGMMMTVKAAQEFQAGSKGKDLNGELNNMQDPLSQHDELVSQLIAKQEEKAGEAEGNGDSGNESGGNPAGGGTEGGNSPTPAGGGAPTGGAPSGSSGSSGGSSTTTA